MAEKKKEVQLGEDKLFVIKALCVRKERYGGRGKSVFIGLCVVLGVHVCECGKVLAALSP